MAKTWRVSFEVLGTAGDLEVSTFHVVDRPDTLGGGLSAGGVCDVVDTWLTTPFHNLVPADSTFQRIVASEDVEFWIPGTSGSAAEKVVSVTGTLGPPDGKLPRECTLWGKASTDTAKRYARGGLHAPSPRSSTYLQAGGVWNQSAGQPYALFQTFLNTLKTAHTYGSGGTGGTLSWVIYSIAQRKRGADNFYFDVQAATVAPRPRWLRTRTSTP